MPRWLYHWLINVFALLAAAALLKGVHVDSAVAGLVAAALLSVVNVSIRPVLVLVTLPINLVTLGLFTLVLNAFMLMLVAWLVPGFIIEGFWQAVWAAVVVALTNGIISRLFPPWDRYRRRIYEDWM